MQLKKINPHLQKALIENDLIEANEMQQETFSTIKSGADAVIQSPKGIRKIYNNCFKCDSTFGKNNG